MPNVKTFPSLYLLIMSPEKRELRLFGGTLIITLNAYYKVYTKWIYVIIVCFCHYIF